MVFGYQGLRPDKIGAVKDGVHKNQKIAQGNVGRILTAFDAKKDESQCPQKSDSDTYQLFGDDFFLDKKGGEHYYDNRGNRDQDRTIDRGRERQSLKEHQHISTHAQHGTEQHPRIIFFVDFLFRAEIGDGPKQNRCADDPEHDKAERFYVVGHNTLGNGVVKSVYDSGPNGGKYGEGPLVQGWMTCLAAATVFLLFPIKM